jgi:hypothetical protein
MLLMARTPFRWAKANNESTPLTVTKKAIMNNSYNFNLIKGVFSPNDAQEIMSNLIESKIQFHKLKIFSRDIRFGENDTESRERIKQLEETKVQLLELLSQAREHNHQLSMKSMINIKVLR